MKDIHYYFILNVGAADGGEVTHAMFQGKIEYKPGAFDAFGDRDEAVSRLESEEIRKQIRCADGNCTDTLTGIMVL